MFHGVRQVLNKQAKSVETLAEPELLPIQDGETLLATERRQQLLKVLPSLSQLPPKEYQSLYLKLVQYFAEFVQELPETKNGYYPYSGGLLDHALERAVRALALSRNYLTSPEGDTKEALLKQAMLRYALFTASLLYDLGKLATKLSVMICNKDGLPIKRWHPYEGSMLNEGTHYKYVFEKENWDYLRGMVTPLIARQLMAKTGRSLHKEKLINANDGFSWIAQDKEILETWFAFFKEDGRQLNSILSIIPLADAQAIANYFDLERPMQEMAQPSAGFWDKYGSAIAAFTEELAKERSKVAGKFAEKEKFREKSEFEHELKLESAKEEEIKRESPPENLQGEAILRRMAVNPATLAMGLAGGLAFCRWLVANVKNNSLTVNNPNSAIHRVNEGIFLTKDIFKRFVDSQTQFKNAEMVQKQFADLGFALDNNNKGNFQYAVDRPGITEVKEGMLLRNPYLIFQTAAALPAINKSLHMVGDALRNFATSKILLENATQTQVQNNPHNKPRTSF